MHGQYEAGTKKKYEQHPQRIAEKKKDHLQCPDTSIKVADKVEIAFFNCRCTSLFNYAVWKGLYMYVINFMVLL